MIHGRVIGRPMTFDIAFAALLFVPPLRAAALIEPLADPPIEFVDVHRVACQGTSRYESVACGAPYGKKRARSRPFMTVGWR